jgi:protein-L-isoaspartate(D-aspartate) O-methyltransferase
MKKTAFARCLLVTASFGWLLACATPPDGGEPASGDLFDFDRARRLMVEEQIVARGVVHPAVTEAMSSVPRHEFVPSAHALEAYADHPVPIGLGQTISQPYIVALMTELLEPEPGDRVLEVGTGSGYQAAVASSVVAQVYSIELLPDLAAAAAERLARLGFDNVEVRSGDGYLGWPERAPFDGILVTAGADHVPSPLVDQLALGARMIIPVGDPLGGQVLQVVEKERDGSLRVTEVTPVRFVPLRRSR